MFYLDREAELTTDLLFRIINEFQNSVFPKLKRYGDYYNGKQDILYKSYADESKACNRVVTNYCRNIANSYAGYLAAPNHIDYSCDYDIEEIMEVLRFNDYQTEDAHFLLNALIWGCAYELMYTNSEGKVGFKLINPEQAFAIYDTTLEENLLYFVRFYEKSQWEANNQWCVDVYTSNEIKHYEMLGPQGVPVFVDSEPHYFGRVPANVFYLENEESIFACIMSLQDAANELLSDEVDDYAAFCDAYLALTGCELDSEDVAMMRQNRILLLPEGGSAEWLTKNASDAQIENILNRIHSSIYRIAQCPDFSAESFVSGVSSGIAIRYRLCGMENKAVIIEAAMRKALLNRLDIICSIASMMGSESKLDDIKITFTRNIPSDNADLVNLVNALQGVVSEQTLLGLIPFVDDAAIEIEKLNRERQERMNVFSFSQDESAAVNE